MKFRFLPDAFYASPSQPWLGEGYSTFDSAKERKRMKDNEDENQYQKDRMTHGSKKVGKPGTPQGKKTYSKWKSEREAAKKKNALRPGEVRKLVNGKWVSNKD